MKPASAQNESAMPSLFQVCAHMEDYAPDLAAKIARQADELVGSKTMPGREAPPAAAGKTAAAAMPSKVGSVRRAPRTETTENGQTAMVKTADQSLRALKKIEFVLEAPSAKSVKLAADFTEWRKFALDLTRQESGVWSVAVPLAAGHYFYRFIVDGHWCDDPRSARQVPNPFGTANAVAEIS